MNNPDRQALEAAREIMRRYIWSSHPDADKAMATEAHIQEVIEGIISRHYSAKLEAAQKMAEALTDLMGLAKFAKANRDGGEFDCTSELIDAAKALKAWESTL